MGSRKISYPDHHQAPGPLGAESGAAREKPSTEGLERAGGGRIQQREEVCGAAPGKCAGPHERGDGPGQGPLVGSTWPCLSSKLDATEVSAKSPPVPPHTWPSCPPAPLWGTPASHLDIWSFTEEGKR